LVKKGEGRGRDEQVIVVGDVDVWRDDGWVLARIVDEGCAPVV
jgi:hypothetical protein